MEISKNYYMKLSNTQIRTIVATLGVVVFLGAYSTLFIVIKNKNNHISALKNQVDLEIRKDQRLNSVKQLMSDLNIELKKIDTYFISKNGVVNFLEKLESLGSVSNTYISVNSVSVNENKNNNLPYEFLRVEFSSRGSWNSIVKLISLVETLHFGVTIERIQLERLPNSGFWQMNIGLTVLKLK